ncbi:MAG: DNA polymerase III subunit beta [Oscillospiraceae bacterium]|jgi:DNA polymerase-3 subunit beta|nr:DNA polymerase III subunit beta [Oscillospiraceae bacterium]
MKFYCDRSELLSAIRIAGRAVAQKSTIPLLEGLLLQAQGSKLVVTGYDLKTGIRTEVEAEVAEPGIVVLNSKLFTEVISAMPADRLTVIGKDMSIKISCFSSEFEILSSPAEDFPELPSIDTEDQIRVPQGILKNMISQTVFAVSDNESKPIHTGSLFELVNGELSVVSVDGYRLALRREDIGEFNRVNEFKQSFVVPGKTLYEIEKICPDDDELAAITVGSHYILFRMGVTEVISRRLEGEFLDYNRAIPKEQKYALFVERKALLTAIDRVSLVIDDTLKSPLKLSIGDGIIKIRAVAAIGKASDECIVKGDGENLEIGFNNRYMLDALKAAPSDELKLLFNMSVNPCIIVSADDEQDNFLYMILPVRLSAVDTAV